MKEEGKGMRGGGEVIKVRRGGGGVGPKIS